ncbi:MAG: SDR family oxidoreductase [Thermoanaerobaculia bacterium]
MALGTILLTGGSGGLGGATVEVLREHGARVAFTFRENEAGARRIEGASEGGARAYPLDLGDPAAPEALVAQVEAELGPLDGLVNAAGLRSDGLLAMTSDEDWDRVLEVNLGGVFRCCRAVLPGMLHRRHGAIVNVASLSARFGLAGQASYAASKAGIVGLTRSLAREVGRRGVRVNAVAPGFVATELTKTVPEEIVARLRERECLAGGVEPRAVAQAIAFLLSDRALAITGQCLFVDAGASA